MRELIERLEKCIGPDRELDAHIFAWQAGGRVHFYDEETKSYVWEKPIDGFWIRRPERVSTTPRYTASLEAAVALVERMLPGQPVLIGWGQTNETRPWARIGGWRNPDATAATPAIALLIALLTALEKEEGNGP